VRVKVSRKIGYIHTLLTCGHEVNFAYRVPLEHIDLVPRRQDGSFGALKCDNCRRKRRVQTAVWRLVA